MNEQNKFIQTLKDTISDFINTEEGFSDVAFKYVFVSDLYEYVSNDDLEYALERKEMISRAYGICYINKDNGIELLVKENTGMTGIATILHELIHCMDFISASVETKEPNLRKVQEVAHIRLWSEFHADSLLRAILQKEFGISDDYIGNGARRWAKDFYNRTGEQALVF